MDAGAKRAAKDAEYRALEFGRAGTPVAWQAGKSHGEVDDYGHFDLLMGRRAQSEVFPHIDRFLDEND